MNKEQIEKLIDDANLSSTASFRIREWFEQNPIEPVVAGLSDEQVDDFIDTWHKSDRYYAVGVYRDWAKTQTFAQPQQSQPNWDDAPVWAEWLAQDENSGWTWYETRPKEVRGYFSTKDRCENTVLKSTNWKESVQRRPIPAPVVEVGQVWKSKRYDDVTSEIIKIEGDSLSLWNEFLGKHEIELSDFLAKFKRVGGE